MKSNLVHQIWNCMLALVLVACSSGSEDLPSPEGTVEKAQIVFTLALDGPMRSRAGSWDPSNPDYSPKDEGNEFENKILPEKLHVWLYPTESTLQACAVEKLLWYRVEGQQNVYEFVGEVPQASIVNGRLSCKVVVVANMDKIGDFDPVASPKAAPTPEQLDAAMFSMNNQWNLDAIPMWGVKTVDAVIQPGVRLTLDTIYLLRALAKVEVKLDKNLEGYELVSVAFDYCKKDAYCLPEGGNAVPATENVSLDDCLRPYPSDSIPSPSFLSEDLLKRVIYMPEYKNDGTLNMKVTLRSKSTEANATPDRSFSLSFSKYVDGKPTNTLMNMVRNHWYTFNISKVSIQGGGLKTDVDTWVQPWSEVNLAPEYE